MGNLDALKTHPTAQVRLYGPKMGFFIFNLVFNLFLSKLKNNIDSFHAAIKTQVSF